MHAPSIWGLLIIGLLVILLFGRPGKLSGFMEDFGKGIKGFRKGLGDADQSAGQSADAAAEPPRQLPKSSEATPARDKTEA
jgi:sec-independent protein translocase protein TatA